MSKYYSILGLSPGATKQEVKKAYRALARRFHPDVNASSDAQIRFQEIEEAYRMIMSGKADRPGSSKRTTYTDPFYDAERQKKEERAERIRKAREMAKKMKAAQEKQQLDAFRRGSTWMIVTLLAFMTNQAFNSWRHSFKINSQMTEQSWAVFSDVRTRNAIYYFYNHEHDRVYGEVYLRKSFREIVTPAGMPLESGHRFRVKYNREQPEYSTVDFYAPASQVVDQYFRKTFTKLRSTMKFGAYSDASLSCLIYELYSRHGIEALARLYFFDEPFIENFTNNSLRFYMFKQSKEYKEVLQFCLDDTL